jgi:dTMP kinase
MVRGRFISFEGVEGAGKSTQIRLLLGALDGIGVSNLLTREPGGCPAGERIRELLLAPSGGFSPLAEALLHYAARREHLDQVVLPALAKGKWVVSDRFADSTMAYQGYGLGLGRETVSALDQLALGGFRPDLTLILDLDSDTGLTRAKARSPDGDRYERLGQEFHRRVREAFLDIARREPERCVVIDAAGPAEQVHREIRRQVGLRLRVAW